jgi:hypothetical protein
MKLIFHYQIFFQLLNFFKWHLKFLFIFLSIFLTNFFQKLFIKFRFFFRTLDLFLQNFLSYIVQSLGDCRLQIICNLFDGRCKLIYLKILLFLWFLFLILNFWFIKNFLQLKWIIIKLKMINLSIFFKTISYEIIIIRRLQLLWRLRKAKWIFFI